MFGRRVAARLAVGLCTAAGLLGATGLACLAQAPVPPAPGAAQTSGLPLPRFVSLKSDRVHIRQGPGTDHKVLWVYRRAGLPVEIISEFEGWRQVRDSDGVTGWVLHTLISGRRTALILPWEIKGTTRPVVDLRSDDRAQAAPVASVEAGVALVEPANWLSDHIELPARVLATSAVALAGQSVKGSSVRLRSAATCLACSAHN